MAKKLKFGFSPCPNDTFILDALVNHKIEGSDDFDFEWIIEDVERLNQMAIDGAIEITKLSYGVYPKLIENYQLLTSGSALGQACGPLIIYKELPEDLAQAKIAIPGFNTTANFLLGFAYPEIDRKEALLFSEIEDAVLNYEVDLGLIIHENRFTYQQKGLKLLKDLGDHWENKTGHHIPLGGFAIQRDLESQDKIRIQQLIQKSIEFAFNHPASSKEWIKSYAQETNDEVIQSHIKLYVNQFSLELGQKGKDSIKYLLKEAKVENELKNIFL